MIEKVVIDGYVINRLAEFGKRGDAMLDLVLARTGRFYRAFIKRNYLAGQVLGKRTGSLAKSLVVFKKKGSKHVCVVASRAIQKENIANVKLANIYEHAGGYTIVPNKAKALSFVVDGNRIFTKKVVGTEHPFMSESVEAFNWGPNFFFATEEVIEKELAKLGLEAR